MVDARSIGDTLRGTIEHLTKVRGGHDVVAPGSPLRLSTPTERQITYIKLRRHQHCEHAVLSSCEKYNITHSELAPLIDAMQALPTHQFYERFTDLRETIAAFAKKWDIDWGVTPEESTDDDDDVGLDGDTLYFGGDDFIEMAVVAGWLAG
jgi:hypothetical protein